MRPWVTIGRVEARLGGRREVGLVGALPGAPGGAQLGQAEHRRVEEAGVQVLAVVVEAFRHRDQRQGVAGAVGEDADGAVVGGAFGLVRLEGDVGREIDLAAERREGAEEDRGFFFEDAVDFFDAAHGLAPVGWP